MILKRADFFNKNKTIYQLQASILTICCQLQRLQAISIDNGGDIKITRIQILEYICFSIQINYNQVLICDKSRSMEETLSLQCQNEGILSGCLFQCPCGKKYRSNPALYKHVKSKHHGTPPGQVLRPPLIPKRRGRPPINPSRVPTYTQKLKNIQIQQSQMFLSDQLIKKQKVITSEDSIAKIANILKQLPNDSINKVRFHELSSIVEMNVYLFKTLQKDSNKDTIGGRLAQMLQQLSIKVGWSQLQQFFTFLMMFLQFIIDELQDRKVILQGHVDLLCNFLNDFLEYKAKQMTRYYEISNLSIFKEDIMLQLFEQVFVWLFLKDYTKYKVSLNSHFKKTIETREDF